MVGWLIGEHGVAAVLGDQLVTFKSHVGANAACRSCLRTAAVEAAAPAAAGVATGTGRPFSGQLQAVGVEQVLELALLV